MGESGKNMFGNYKRVLDDKNRVLIPSKLRKELSKVLYITIGPDNVLEIRDEEEFKILKNKLLSTNTLNKKARIYSRILLGNTHDIEIDKQGRIALPDNFIAKTGITKNITFIGVGSKIELWPTSEYEKFEMNFNGEKSLDKLADELMQEGIEI